MQQQPPQTQSSPFVSQKQLSEFIGKQVVVAGALVTATPTNLVLDAGDGSNITVMRNQPPSIQFQIGTKLLIRGMVKPDLSVAESSFFPPSDVGNNFDLSLFNQAAAVTNHINYSHIFA
ncbi:unnamed protein product [Agarophyton chilense]